MFRRLPARASVLASVVLSLALTSACTDGTLPSSLGDASAVDASDDTAFRRGSPPGKGPSWKSVATSVEITPGEFALNVAAEADLSATVRNRTGHTLESTVTWTSTDPTVASVAGGSVKGLKAGNALIIASVNDLADTATARVTTERVEIDSLIVSPASASVIVGQKLTLTVQTVDSAGSALAGRTVTWASSDAAVATVTAAGVLTGIAPGRASVTATSEGSSASVDVTVSPVPAVPVATVTVSPSPAAATEDATLQLAAATADADGEVLTGRTITWKSSNESVAKVSSTGLLTGTGAGTATITATSEGQTGTTTAQVAASTIAVATVSVSPSTGSIAAGASLQLVATPKDAGGKTLTGRTIAWSSSNTAAATVSASGLVKGVAGGSASIHATVEGKRGSAAITVTSAPTDPAPDPTPDPTEPTERVGYYVAPSGSSAGSGTKASPWDLSSVLRGSMPVRGGDTVWVRGGRYRGDFISYLNGSSGQLIVVRAYPGERATIDGHLAISGSYTAFWGLEVMMSSPNRAGGTDKNGVNVRAPGSKLINMVVHDIDHVGIGTWKEAPDSEIYGTIVYNVGYQGDSRGHGHSLYIQNLSGLKRVRDNIMYNSFSYGVQAWTSPGQYLRNIAFEGNVVFNSGMLASGSARPDLMVGGADAAAGISLRNNYTFRNDGGMTANLSYGGTVHRDLTYVSNYLVGTVTLDPSKWTSISQSGNSVMANSTSGSSRVIVRPNAYERGRANIIVYNWGGQGMVSADLSGVLSAGDSYEVRNVQDFFGTPVASGTFSGGSISIPIRTVAPPTVLGGSGKAPPSTGTRFQVFVVVKR